MIAWTFITAGLTANLFTAYMRPSHRWALLLVWLGLSLFLHMSKP